MREMAAKLGTGHHLARRQWKVWDTEKLVPAGFFTCEEQKLQQKNVSLL